MTMSATPFTGTGEKSQIATPAANAPTPEEIERERIREELEGDRVMLWPAYYRTRRDEGLTQTIFWPLAVWHRAKDNYDAAVFPIFARRRSPERSMLMTPLGGFRDEKEKDKGWQSILWPVWFRKWDGEKRSWHLLYPIVHRTENKGGAYGNIVFPLFGQGRFEDGFYFVTALYGIQRDRIRDWHQRHIALFLYSSSREKQNRQQAILLLAQRHHTVKDNGETETHRMIIPLYFEKKKSDGSHSQFFLPLLLARETNPESKITSDFEVGLENHERESGFRPRGRYEAKSFSYEGDLHSDTALLGIYQNRNILRVTQSSDPVTSLTITSTRHRKSHLFPIYSRESDTEGRSRFIMPIAGFFSKHTWPRPEVKEGKVDGVRTRFQRIEYRGGPKGSQRISETQALLSLFKSSVNAVPNKGDASTTESLDFHDRKTSWLFPFYYHRAEETVGKRTRFLLGLYSANTYETPGEPTASRSRFLYKFYHRVREGDRVRGEAFPFIAWERTEDVKRWGFLGGFIGHASDAEESRTRILWIPIRSKKDSSG